jgi:hypothetical protein
MVKPAISQANSYLLVRRLSAAVDVVLSYCLTGLNQPPPKHPKLGGTGGCLAF